MASNTYRGVVRRGTIVPEEQPATLTEGTEVLITPVGKPGSAAAVLEAVDAPPHVPAEWVDELEELIAAGRRPPVQDRLFEQE